MVKLGPEWFPPTKLAFACGLLSLSFVFGGALAVAFAGMVAGLSGDSWRVILAAPALVLAVLAVGVWWGIGRPRSQHSATAELAAGPTRRPVRLGALFRQRSFLVILALSFALNLLRETFNFWTVDFIRTEGGSQVTNSLAAFLSAPFDVCGAVGILLVGWAFGRLGPSDRQVFLAALLGALALLLAAFPLFFKSSLTVLTVGVGVVGFLAYGPYSLLAGVLAVEVLGRNSAATVAGFVDGVGYLAGVLSGVVFGKLLTLGGYRLGFQVMAGVTMIAAGLCFLLYRRPAEIAAAPAAFKPNPDFETT
jgi:OPA family sugar phosphate sensor protein UhpC-like MFS transporter